MLFFPHRFGVNTLHIESLADQPLTQVPQFFGAFGISCVWLNRLYLAFI